MAEFSGTGARIVINNSHLVDGIAVSAEEFRSDPEREEAEELLVAAYQSAVGRFICKKHRIAAAYQLRFITASGECKISTVACCQEFAAELNDLLATSIASSSADPQQHS